MNTITRYLVRLAWSCAALIAAGTAAGEPVSFPASIKGISVLETEPASVPRSLYRTGVNAGWTKVAVGVDENGQLLDALVLGYSNQAYADATLAALHKWKFRPASVRGKPIPSVTQLFFNYSHVSGTAQVVLLDGMDYMRQSNSQGAVNKLFRLDELDRIPIPLHLVSPAYSDENIRQHAGKKAIVDFYIDETGKVRLPTLYYADDSEVARLALAAVAQWTFEPPTHHGNAVITRARQEFVFKPKAEDQPAPPPAD